MQAVTRNILIAIFVFISPLAVVVGANWSEFEPFVIGDPATAEGELLYFSRRG